MTICNQTGIIHINVVMNFLRFQRHTISTPLGLKSLKTNQFLFTSRLNFVPNFIAIGWRLRPTKLRYIHIYLMEGSFVVLGAMIGETMMKFFRSRTMRASAIGIFLRNLLKNNRWSYGKLIDHEMTSFKSFLLWVINLKKISLWVKIQFQDSTQTNS